MGLGTWGWAHWLLSVGNAKKQSPLEAGAETEWTGLREAMGGCIQSKVLRKQNIE